MRHRCSRESQTFRHNDFFCTVAVVGLEELPASQSLEAQICGKRRSLGASGVEFLGWVFNSEEQNSPDFLFRVSLRSRTGDHNAHWDPGTHASHVQSRATGCFHGFNRPKVAFLSFCTLPYNPHPKPQAPVWPARSLPRNSRKV